VGGGPKLIVFQEPWEVSRPEVIIGTCVMMAVGMSCPPLFARGRQADSSKRTWKAVGVVVMPVSLDISSRSPFAPCLWPGEEFRRRKYRNSLSATKWCVAITQHSPTEHNSHLLSLLLFVVERTGPDSSHLESFKDRQSGVG
jgi:hypothetical protein